MKKLILITSLLFIILSPISVYAYPGQYSWDPIYIKEIENRSISNKETIQRLKNQYGISAFYVCYPCSGMDTSNPSTESNCLITTEHCLESKQLKDNTRAEWDQECKKSGGPYAILGTIDEVNKTYYCDCMTGYTFENNLCVKKQLYNCPPTQIYINGICQNKDATIAVVRGFSLPDNTTSLDNSNNTKNESLSCPDGYILSLDKKSCTKIPKNAHTVISNTDLWLCNDGYKEFNNSCIKKTPDIIVEEFKAEPEEKIIPPEEPKVLGAKEINEEDKPNVIINFFTTIFNNIINWFK